MFTEKDVESACDELAEVIDHKEGQIDVAELLDVLIQRVCAEDKDVNGEAFRTALLSKFGDIFRCNPFVYAENSKDDVAYEKNNSNLDVEDDDPIVDDWQLSDA